MADVFTKEKRSEIMSKIRSKHTKPEILVFKELRRHKIYFQKHYKVKRISIDIALPSKKKAIFVDGDFWHGYKFDPKKSKLPKKYWIKKIEGNVIRDKRNRSYLRRNGWKVIKIWEHQINKSKIESIKKIVDFLKKR